MTTTPTCTLITIVATFSLILDSPAPRLGWVCRLLFPFRLDCSCSRTLRLVWRRALQWRNLSRGVREDRANRWVIVAFGLIGVLAAYLPAYTDRNGFWTLDGDAIRWLGVVLFAAGGALRI